MQDNLSLAAADVPPPTKNQQSRSKYISEVFAVLRTYGVKWEDLLKEEEYQLVDGTKKMVPKILTLCSGPVNNQKIGIANYFLIDYNARVKKQARNELCPWLEPVTQNVRNRIILAELRETYNWQMTLENFKGKGLLLSYLESLYSKRTKLYASASYGVKEKKRRLDEWEAKKLDLSKFDENSPDQHLIKLLFACGLQGGFRGNTEHANLEVHHITRGSYPPNHPLEGKLWYAETNFMDKTHKLSFHNSHLRDDREFFRSPVLESNPDTLGGILHRLLPKITPGQTRIYCKPMSREQREQYITSGGDHNAR